MSTKRRKKRMYVIWVIISVLAIASMVIFSLAPLLSVY
ncbi:MAG: hypothetical protein ACD_11C00021G0006 [uncultured bacterium]|nr:MAG: hypothetical protein ACD_11C00021G0006 [uncultured bacterium]